MTRVDSFNKVILDFENVEVVGQELADEIIRVLPAKHKGTEVIAFNAIEAVLQMISRAKILIVDQFLAACFPKPGIYTERRYSL